MRTKVFFLGILFPLVVWSFPVFSLHEYYVLLQQLDVMQSQLNQGGEMLSILEKTKKSTEGHYGMGSFLEDTAHFSKRSWSQKTWNAALESKKTGEKNRYSELIQDYNTRYSPISEKQFSQGASAALTKNYKNTLQNNRVAKASADYVYEQIQQHLESVHALTQKIEQAENIKSAMDLNSRLLSELSYIEIEHLRMQTLLNHQVASSQNSDIHARERESIFNRLPEER